MSILFEHHSKDSSPIEVDLCTASTDEELKKTRRALDCAYAGFNYATEEEIIDSFIYEIDALTKRYAFLTSLAKQEALANIPSRKKSAIRTLICHIFG